jgi:hypothetical protein
MYSYYTAELMRKQKGRFAREHADAVALTEGRVIRAALIGMTTLRLTLASAGTARRSGGVGARSLLEKRLALSFF